jgi:transcriptional regulator with XRE-family HTH domain
MPKTATPLKLELLKRGLIQADIAEKAHLSESRLNRILNGRASAQDYELKNLARALGVPRDELPV